MEKSKINILVIIGLLIFICSLTYLTFDTNDLMDVDGVKFTIPSGYHESAIKDGNLKANLTDGIHLLYIGVYNDSDVNKHVNDYVNEKSNTTNETINLSNFTIDGLVIHKSFSEKTNAIHYWFVKNGKVYTVYNWGGDNSKMDSTFVKLIGNM